MRRVAVIHGPNLNLLGRREPQLYGRTTLAEIDAALRTRGAQLGLTVETFQSNSEGALVDFIQGLLAPPASAPGAEAVVDPSPRGAARVDAIVINPGAYTHTSVALRDVLLAVDLPVVEVHLTNPARREEFRHRSFIDDVAVARVMGFGADGYALALDGVASLLARAQAAAAASAREPTGSG